MLFTSWDQGRRQTKMWNDQLLRLAFWHFFEWTIWNEELPITCFYLEDHFQDITVWTFHKFYIIQLHIPDFLWTVNLLLLKKKIPKTVIFSPQCKWCLLMSAAHDQSSPFWYRSSPYLNWTVRASTWETRPVQPSWQPLHTRYLLSLSTVVQLARWVQSHFTYCFIKARNNSWGIASKRLNLSSTIHLTRAF